MTDKIFDLSNIDDLPDSLVEDARLTTVNLMHDKIIDVLSRAEGPVSASLLIVAVYRLYGVEVKKTVMNSTLSYMKNAGSLIRPSHAHYALPEVTDRVEEATNEVEA